MTIAALYVDPGPRGVYAGRPDVEPWGLPDRDARGYAGPHPVVAHPPCAPWGRFSKPTPASKARGPLRGDDGGCFRAALASVCLHGGVLEHPRDTAAWVAFNIVRPPAGGGWVEWARPSWHDTAGTRAYVCAVEQGHYGHAARKPTWLLYVGARPPFDLLWGPSDPPPIGTGARRGNLESMSKRQRAATPPAFAATLIALAEWSRP